MFKIKNIIFVILVSSFSYLKAAPLSVYSTTQCLAKGGACSAMVEDYSSIFVNPSLLNYIEKEGFRVEVQIEGSSKIDKLSNGILGESPYWKFKDQSLFQSLEGKNISGGLSFLTSYLKKSWALSFFAKSSLSSNFVDQDTANIYFGTDLGLQYTYAKSFLRDKRLKLGFNIKTIHRSASFGLKDYSYLSTNGFYNAGYEQNGIAFAVDLGSQYKIKRKNYETNFALSFLDLGSPFFLHTMSTDKNPPGLIKRVVIGTNFTYYDIFKGITLSTNLDLIKGLTKNETRIIDSVMWGINFKLPKFFSFSTGFYQGNWTAGFGLDFWILDVNFASYQINTLAYEGGKSTSNRRYTVQVGFNF